MEPEEFDSQAADTNLEEEATLEQNCTNSATGFQQQFGPSKICLRRKRRVNGSCVNCEKCSKPFKYVASLVKHSNTCTLVVQQNKRPKNKEFYDGTKLESHFTREQTEKQFWRCSRNSLSLANNLLHFQHLYKCDLR